MACAERLWQRRQKLRCAYEETRGSDPALWPTQHPGVRLGANAGCLDCHWLHVYGRYLDSGGYEQHRILARRQPSRGGPPFAGARTCRALLRTSDRGICGAAPTRLTTRKAGQLLGWTIIFSSNGMFRVARNANVYETSLIGRAVSTLRSGLPAGWQLTVADANDADGADLVISSDASVKVTLAIDAQATTRDSAEKTISQRQLLLPARRLVAAGGECGDAVTPSRCRLARR